MGLTRRNAVLGFGAALVSPMLAPGKAVAGCLGRWRHRRASCCGPVPCPPSSCGAEAVRWIRFLPAELPFKLMTPLEQDPIQITIQAASGTPYHLHVVKIEDVPDDGKPTNILWTPPTNFGNLPPEAGASALYVKSGPYLLSGELPTEPSLLKITLVSQVDTDCNQVFYYRVRYSH